MTESILNTFFDFENSGDYVDIRLAQRPTVNPGAYMTLGLYLLEEVQHNPRIIKDIFENEERYIIETGVLKDTESTLNQMKLGLVLLLTKKNKYSLDNNTQTEIVKLLLDVDRGFFDFFNPGLAYNDSTKFDEFIREMRITIPNPLFSEFTMAKYHFKDGNVDVLNQVMGLWKEENAFRINRLKDYIIKNTSSTLASAYIRNLTYDIGIQTRVIEAMFSKSISKYKTSS